jgi:uncharacterized membrane protein YoaK (UPF0700 family)
MSSAQADPRTEHSWGARAGAWRTLQPASDSRHGPLLVAVLIQLPATTAAFIIALVGGAPYGTGAAIALIALLGVGMGLQNAAARALGVPDLTTTVLTLTITGIAADSRAAGGTDSRTGRRLLSVTSMFVGALAGVILIRADLPAWALLGAVILLTTVAVAGVRASRSDAPWVSPS